MERFKSLSHSKWECKYHVVWIPKYRRKELYGDKRKVVISFWREKRQKRVPNERSEEGSPSSQL